MKMEEADNKHAWVETIYLLIVSLWSTDHILYKLLNFVFFPAEYFCSFHF